MEYEVEGRSGRAGRQVLNKELQQKLAMLETFLREAATFTNVGGSDNQLGWMGLSCLCVSKQWKSFVGKVLDAYSQVLLNYVYSHDNNIASCCCLKSLSFSFGYWRPIQ